MTQQEFQLRYQFNLKEDKIGGGSFGTVFKAYDTVLDREVAIKVSEVKQVGDKEFSLLEEYKAIESLADHPHIANYETVYRFESFPATYDYGIMQYYPLGNLSHYLKTNKVSKQDREKLVLGILEGIAFMHQYKVVHRDLKPSNILVVDRRGQLIPKITDFGLSKQADADTKGSRFTNSFAGGTLQYSSPEQIKGQPLKLNTDLWSFGVIAYEILTGNTLFETQSESTATAEWQKQITEMILHADVSEKFKTLDTNWQKAIAACLQREPSHRVQTTDALLKLINQDTSLDQAEEPASAAPNTDETFIKEPTSKEAEAKPEETKAKKPKRPQWLIPVAAISGVVLLVISYFIVKPGTITEPEQPNLQLYEEEGLYGYKLGDSTAIPAGFTTAKAFEKGQAEVSRNDSVFTINDKGEFIELLNQEELTEIAKAKEEEEQKAKAEEERLAKIEAEKKVAKEADQKAEADSKRQDQKRQEQSNNQPQYKNFKAGIRAVKIPGKSYYMGETEVTIGQYLQFCKAVGKHYPRWLKEGSEYNIYTGTDNTYKKRGMSESNTNFPITGVTYQDAKAFAQWAGGRLPTSDEWKHAAMGGEDYTYAGSNNIDEVAWYENNSGGKPHAVKGKKPNGYGLYDMSGNVQEWTSSGTYRVLRGGWYNSNAKNYRIVDYNYSPDGTTVDTGFRVLFQ